MRISIVLEEEMKKRIKTRHYYLKQAHNSVKLKDMGQMHTFCSLAEAEQKQIDEFAKMYPNYELSKCI